MDTEQPPRLPFVVVGVGASAGGLEAFSEFLLAMPPDAGISFVLVQHLPPDRESMLAEILARRTPMPVRQVEDGMAVEPNHVYVIRPGHRLTLEEGRLRLGPTLGSARAANRPVDDFFKSLAEEQRERAVCILMSGMGSNGTAGAQVVKAVGGLCIAQDPDSAQFPSMPRHLIDAGYADYILAPRDIPDALLTFAGSPYTQGEREAPAEAILQREEQHLREILAILRTRTRKDFNGYKKPTVLRRVQRRMGLTRARDLADYARHLRQSPSEVIALADDLLIHVSGFFRDAEAWETLRQRVIAPLVAARESDTQLRAWVTACASGEEAYTLTMLLLEEIEQAGKSLDVKVFATDLADRPLVYARAGLYPGGIESEISPERLARFFVREDEVYRVRQEVRDRVVFAPQNILQDPPFSRIDIATCRNLLIYLQPEMQHRVLNLVHFGLREGGALFLGTSETIAGMEDLFEPVDKKARIFRRIGPTRHGFMDFPAPHNRAATPAVTGGRAGLRRTDGGRSSVAELTQRELLDHHTPAAVTVDRDQQVLYFHGDTRPYLLQPTGEPTRDLLLLAREGVRGAIRVALHRAMVENLPATAVEGWIDVEPDRRLRIAVTVSPVSRSALDEGSGPANLYVVSFAERGEIHLAAAPGVNGEQSTDELRRLRSELQTTIEELQTTNEEMKASNEEVMSINEELQSANEELETSKEEMQSLNEELTTVNAQLRAKVDEHQTTSSDLSSLLASTDIAVLFLDTALRIRRYTPAARALLDPIPADIGRPLAALARKFDDPHLDDDARQVLERLIPAEREVGGANDRHYLRRVLPYRTLDNHIDGVVVTFVDITPRKQMELALLASEEQFRRAVVDAPIPVIMQAEDGQVLQISQTWTELTGYTLADIPTVDAWLTRAYGTGADEVRAHMQELFKGDRKTLGVEFIVRTRSRGDRRWSFSASAPGRLRDGRRFLVGMAVDVTERRRAEDRLRQMLNIDAVGVIVFDRAGTLVEANDTFLRMTGFDRADVAAGALTWKRLTPPEHLAESERQLARLAETGRIGPYEKEYFRKDGSRSWLLFAGAALGDGTTVEYVIDIANRKQMQEALRLSQNRLRLALGAARMGIWTLDLTTNLQTRDANLNRLLGLEAAETAQPFSQFLSLIHPHDRAAVQAGFAASAKRNQPLNLEFRVVRPNGEIRWLRDQGDVFGDPVSGHTMAGACVDVTERRAAENALRDSEERLRLIVESATDYAIYTMSPDRIITSWSPGAEHIFGWTEKEIIGQSGDIVFTEEDRAAAVPQNEARTAQRHGRAADERWHRRKDGSRFFASGVLTPLGSAQHLGFVKVLRDLTERVQMEEALRQGRDELETRVRQRTAELSQRSDQLRALAGEITLVEQRERRQLAKVLHDHLQQSLVAIQLRVASLADLESTPKEDEVAKIEELLGECLRTCRTLTAELCPPALYEGGLFPGLQWLANWMADRHGLEVELSGSSELPVLRDDLKVLLFESVRELLFNVVKHADVSAADVEVRQDDPQHLSITIRDQGHGFDPTPLGLAGQRPGGFGLFSIRERLELIGGRMEIESTPDQGTQIRLTAPIEEPASPPDADGPQG